MVEPQARFPGCAHLGYLADSLAEPSGNTELLNSSQATPWKPPREGQGHCPSPITGGWGDWRALRNPAFELRSPSDSPSHHAGPRGGQAGGAMQGGKELPTLHSRESLRHAPGMPTPSTPRPHLKDLGARLSKPVSTGNSCSPFPAARLLSKLHCASAGGKPSFSPQQTRRGFLPSLVNVPEESQSWSLPVVTISCIWVRAHTYLCTITGTLQKPAMDLQPAEVVSEECGHLHSVPGARPRLSEHLATAGLGAEKSWGCWGRSPLQAPFCCVTGSEGGAPAQLEADVSQNCWPFQDFTPGPGQHLAH